jgi:hypothetical protein
LQRLFIDKCKNISKLHKVASFGEIVQKTCTKEAFEKIYESSLQLKDSEKFRHLFDAHWTLKSVSNIQKQLLIFLKLTYRNKLFAAKLQKIFNSKAIGFYTKVLQKLNFKQKVRTSNISLALEKLTTLNERVSKKNVFQALNFPKYKFFKILSKSVSIVMSESFK